MEISSNVEVRWISILFFVFSVPAWATNMIGIGAGENPKYLGAKETHIVPLVVAAHISKYIFFEWEGDEGRLGLRLSNWILGPSLGYLTGRDPNDIDAVRLKRLGEVEESFPYGGFLAYRIPQFLGGKEDSLTITAQFLKDTYSENDFEISSFILEYFFRIFVFLRAEVEIGVEYFDKDFSKTYFQITPIDSVRTGYPLFAPNGDTQLFRFGISPLISFHPNFGLLLAYQYSFLRGEAVKSPLVKDDGSKKQVFYGGSFFILF